MASTTILFRQGSTAPSGNSFGSTVGEPLWCSAENKLYVTNGTSTPTLIGPVSSSSYTFTGSDGASVTTSGSAVTVKAKLSSYTGIGEAGSYSSTSNANITNASLTTASGNLCTKESSAFGSDAAVEYDQNNSYIEWTPSGTSRSHTSVLINDVTSTDITLRIKGANRACQSDHYLYIMNNSKSSVTVTVGASGSEQWAGYFGGESGFKLIGIPDPITIPDGKSAEFCFKSRKYTESGLNTASVTVQGPLNATADGSQPTVNPK